MSDETKSLITQAILGEIARTVIVSVIPTLKDDSNALSISHNTVQSTLNK